MTIGHSVTVKSPWLAAPAQGRVAGSVLSFAALVAAVALRWALDPVLGDALPFVTLFGAVAAATWLSGFGAAIAVALAGYLVVAYLFIPPRGAITLSDSADMAGLVAYLFTCGLIIAIGEAMRAARRREAESRDVLRVTLRSIGDGVIATDVDGNVAYLNTVAETLTGWSPQQAVGRPLTSVFRIVNETTRAPVENPALRALREGAVVGLANHTVLIRRDGTECPIDDSAAPIIDEHGRVSGCVLIFRDVTEQRQLEREKHAQLFTARRLASIVESSEAAMIGKNLDGIIQSWNAAAERLFGYTAEQAIGRHISLVIPPDRLAEEDKIISTLKAGRRIEHFETERVRADGRRVQISLTVSPIKDDDGNVIGASKIVRDITRERETEAERARLVTLIENSKDFIAICDLDGIPIYVNRAGLDLVGLESVAAARGVHIWDFFFAEDQDRIRNELFPRVLATGHGELEVRFRHFKTAEARWMAYKVLALTDEDGKPIAVGTVSQDITHRKALENDLRRLAAELAESNQRKSEFLATLAHELRGPLAPLKNVVEIWKRSTSAEQLAPARATMERQLGQMVRLVDDLLDLNRITHNRLELRQARLELATVIEHALETARPLADARRHELEVTLPKEPLYLQGDAARLAQVFSNLLSNSCKYTDQGGKISLTAQRRGDDVIIAVKDTGVGIPADRIASVFDMFSQADPTLEHAQGGLGIGLTLVKQLVAMHGGTVEARSGGRGLGSEFIVTLPIDLSAAPAVGAASAAGNGKGPSRRILVVDDNVDSANSLSMLLELEGHDAFVVHDGPSAIDAAEKRRPDVVLLDIGLPRMNGHEVCRALRERPWSKDLVVIALTGWGQTEDRRKSQDAGFDGHLVKPVNYATLAELLTSLPGDRRGSDSAPQ
jgi:PAS domain S-box-containing protein